MKKETLSWINKKLDLKEIAGCGYGVFSTKKIKKGETLAISGGHIIPATEEAKLSNKINDHGLQVSEEMVLGMKNEAELEYACFFNHSCDPNAGIKGQIFMVAMRDIERGEQITFDYAMTLHKVKGLPPYKMKCLCGSKICRGIVTDSDWKIPALQKKYAGYFQWYLEEKIKKTRR